MSPTHKPTAAARSQHSASSSSQGASENTELTIMVDPASPAPSTAEGKKPAGQSTVTVQKTNASAVSTNPLLDLSEREILTDADRFAEANGLVEFLPAIRRGSLAAKVQHLEGGYRRLAGISEEDKEILRFEEKHPWKSSPKTLFALCALCAGCAIVQGADQTVINGAQEFYFREFGITDPLMKGLVNGSPYAAAALIGCWLNGPLNRWCGRRGTLAIGCALACLTAVWQAAATHWFILLSGRLALGLAVGAKSATTPIYAAECAPKAIRGALVMMWQMYTAFGIMMGFAISLAFQHFDFMGPNSQWRWMIGVTAIPPLIVGCFVYLLPESPRWYMDRGQFKKAFQSMQKLRRHDILAARDMYLAYKFLEAERDQQRNNRNAWGVFKEFFTVRRNRRAAQSAWFCMFMQQFCGVNVIAYYSTKIFMDAGYDQSTALLISFGTGLCNFLGAIPAVLTIDRFGRRNLLVTTFPIMAALLAWTSVTFTMEPSQTRLILIAVSLYLFMLVYSPGMGPVPFTYSAEAFPLHIRAVGMASATSITWAFNFLISFAWPKMAETFTVSGGFAWYATWNMVGFVFAWFLIPETKNKTLEELDIVFSVRNRDHASYYLTRLKRIGLQTIGAELDPQPPLYETPEQTPAQAETEPKP